MNAESLIKAVCCVSEIMKENRNYLIELDQQNGDGDLGISMDEGFRAAYTVLKGSEDKDLGKLLQKASRSFNEAAPSSLGTIISIGMSGMAKALKGRDEANEAEFAEAFDKGILSIMEKANSGPGEKTILDALIPASETLKAMSDQGFKSALKAAYDAAAKGSEKTREMKAVHGRAAYYGEQSLGVLDGGSVAGKLIFAGIIKSLES